MKKINLKLVAITLVTFLFVTFAKAEIVFQDTFNNIPGSGDINTSNSISGRQFGKLAPLNYSEIGTPGSLVGATAPFPGKLNWGPNMISPDHNFTELTNGFTIEFDILTTGTISWTGISIGAESQDERINTTKGIGFLFHHQGYFQMSDNSDIVAAFGPDTIPSGQFFHVLISVSTKSFDENDDVKIALFLDGKPININNIGGGNNLIYTRKEPFKSNYIILDSWAEPGSKTTIDNFTIRSTTSKFYEYNWTNDISSQISSSKTYSHKINLGDDDDVTINSELFTGSSLNISGANWALINGYGDNNFARGTVPDPEITGNGTNLVYEFFLEGYNQSSAIILSNLTPGATYTFTLYNRGFAGNRKAIFAAGDSESSIVELNQNLNGNGGTLFKYIYTAPDNGVFSMAVTPAETNSIQYLFYAFSNEISPPAPPANVLASQGNFTDKVVVNWNTVDGADKYQVWRNDSDDSSSAATLSTELSETTFTDTTATVNLDYYYWVKAKNTNGWSDFGESALGFSTDSTRPIKPSNVLPIDNAKVSDFPMNLKGSDYSDAAWPMVSVQWQIDNRTSFASPIYDSEELFVTNTSIIIPTGPLVISNYWRVRYKNSRNKWSDWSDHTLFIAERNFDSPFYFYETFNNISGSGDVNKDYYVSGRQLGSFAPVDYISQGTAEVGDAATNPNKLTLSGEESSCSPNQSFDEYDNFKIEVNIEPSPDGTAICFGKSTQNATPKSVGGMGIVFYGNGSGRYDVYDSDALLAVITNSAATGVMNVSISVGSDAKIDMFVNGTPLPLEKYWLTFTNADPNWAWAEVGWRYRYIHEKGSEFSKNFISFYNLGGVGIINNFSIQNSDTNATLYSWTQDSDSRINAANNYTHNINLCSDDDVTINTVLFSGAGKTTNIFIPNGDTTLTGTNWAGFDSDGEFEQNLGWAVVANNVAPSGNELLNDVLIDKFGDYYLQLNVTPGSSNMFTIYRHAWVNNEPFQIVANDGGAPVELTCGLVGNGAIIEYKYQAPENGIFNVVLSPVKTISAFSNYEIGISEPIIETINSLDFGEVLQGESKTFQLPVFNFGAGIVSGNVNGISAPFSFSTGSDYFAIPKSPDFVNITFSPTGEDYFSNSVSLIGSGGNAEIELKGLGVPEPGIVFSILFSVFCIFFAKRK